MNEELNQGHCHIFKLYIYLLCLAGRNLWTGSPLYAGILNSVIFSFFIMNEHCLLLRFTNIHFFLLSTKG